MNREEVFYLIPYLLSLAITTGVFAYTWRHRYIRGAEIYSWFAGGQAITTLGFIFELVSPNLQTKILWDKFQWLTLSFLVFIPFLVFSIQFSGHRLRHPRITWGYLIGMPLLFTLFLLTDGIHHLAYPNPHLSTDFPFPDLKYDLTWVVYLYSFLYIYGSNFYGIGLLTRRAVQSNTLYRLQYWTIAIGFLIPLLLSFFALADIRITPQRDITPFTFAIGNIVVTWGLFRYRLFDIVPIARERIIEGMTDPIVVLDINNRIVDINPPALVALEKTTTQIIGLPSNEVFEKWPIIVSELESRTVERKEIAIKSDDDTVFYDLNISPIEDKMGHLIGRIIVARDITRHKTLEVSYRILSEELEQRVNQRTEELRQIAELYRAVVENQTEFIVRWKPDGIRTFANDAYCRYFGITYNQALSSDFMPLIVDEDRPAVEAKILRLKSGETNTETETHRVIKRDGSIGWQEWTDQAIRDEAGKLVEFLSVGRDVTARKQAEEDLATAYDTTLEGWARALELRDKETEGHSRRVTETTLTVARAMGFSEDDLVHIRRGSILHDIGKMGIPDEILRKNGPLTEEERAVVVKHPTTAHNLLKPIPYLEKAMDIPYCHHEKWDGTGYPRGLKGEEIPLAARIFAVVDVWDALSSDRPYRNAWSREKVTDYMVAETGKHFDPKVVDVFLKMVEQGEI